MTDPNTPDPLPARVRGLLTDAVGRLDDTDRAERIAYCRTHNEHGIRMHLTADDDLLEFRWGGRRLAMLPRDVLLHDGPVESQLIAELPDTIPDDWNDQ